MHLNVQRLVGAGAALLAVAAWASHPVTPLNLQQRSGGAALAAGSIIPTGQAVEITADSDGSTCGGSYSLDIEIRETSQSFTNTPTHASASMTKNNCSQDPYPWTSVTLVAGNYKWQVREVAPIGVSSWTAFNGGNTAFTVAPPNVPDILVDSVTMTNVVSNPTDLSFTVNGGFKNRGTVATGPFQWKAYLSLNKTLEATDTLLFTSAANAVDVPGQSTVADSSGQLTISPRPPPGAYYIVIEADPPATAGCTTNCGAVSEFDEKNNVGSTANYFINGVDMVATAISNGPAQAGPGVPITLTLDFYNQGVDAPANPVDFRVFATRAVPVTQPYVVYTGSVTVGGSQIFSLPVTFTLPPGVSGGDVWWGLDLDPSNTLVEAIETNNQAISSLQTHVQQADLMAAAADLVEVKTGATLRKADIGFPARFRVTVDNVGDWASLPTKMGVILSKDNTLSLLSDYLFEDVDLPSVDYLPGQNRALVDAFVNIPNRDKQGNSLPAGDYYFFVYLDSFNLLNELNESNNTVPIHGPVRLRLPTPDYALTRLATVTTAAGGEAIPVSRVIKNIGTQDGPVVDYRCFASPNAIITTQDFPLRFVEPGGGTVQSRGIQLAMGGEDDRTETVRLPGGIPAGNYYVGCIVDPANALPELEEANNSRSTSNLVAVAAQTFQVVTQQLPDAVVGIPYAFHLSATGAPSSAVAWALAGNAQLPEGLSIAADGEITGTPTVTGVRTFTVYAQSGNFTAERVLVLRVLPPTAQLTITSDNLPPIVNSTTLTYQGSLSASGGAQPYKWSIVSGALPSGITLDGNSGLITGNVRAGVAPGEVKLRVRVRDSLGGSAEKDLRVRVLAPGALSIVTLGLPDAIVNTEYLADLAVQVAGGGALSKPITWQVVSGRLPEGLLLETHADQSTGILSGKATLAGTYSLTVQATDNDGRADVVDFVVRIFPAQIKIFFAQAPPELHPGDQVSLTVTSNGTGTKYRLYSGALPPGVQLTADGNMSGTIADDPTSIGPYNFVVEGVDAMGGQGLAAFVLEVKPRPVETGCGGSATGLPAALPALLALAGIGLLRRRRARR